MKRKIRPVSIVLAVVLALSLCGCAKSDAIKNFKTLSTDIGQLQNSVSSKISEAETLLAATKAEDLSDSTLLDQLKTAIDAAKTFSVSIPTVASETEAIEKQNQDLTTQRDSVQKYYDSLDSAINALSANKEAKAQEIAAEEDAKIQEMITAKNTYSITATDENGNKEKITITIGSWIKGSETELLDKAWAQVGGEGTMPLTGKYSRSKSGWTEGDFTASDAAYVFGTVSIENLTPDFAAENFGNGRSCAYLYMDLPNSGGFSTWKYADSDIGDVVKAIQYGSGVDCALLNYDSLASADMVSNNWGPVPFVIGADTVFSPKYPDGNPILNNVTIFLLSSPWSGSTDVGDQEFQIGKTW